MAGGKQDRNNRTGLKLQEVEKVGEQVVLDILERLGNHVPEKEIRAAKQLVKDARHWTRSLRGAAEETAKKTVEQMRIPSRKELEQVEKRVRKAIETTTQDILERRRTATRKDIEDMAGMLKTAVTEEIRKSEQRHDVTSLREEVKQVALEVRALRKEVEKISGEKSRTGSTKKKQSSARTAAKPAI